MCLGIPGRIEQVWAENGTTMATADFAGEQRRICLAYLPELVEGDYVIVHAGFALTKVAPAEAEETLKVMRQYGIIDDPVEAGASAASVSAAGMARPAEDGVA